MLSTVDERSHMSSSLTRRDFLTDAAMTGAAAVLNLEHLPPTRKTAMDTPFDRRSNFDRQWKFIKGDAADADSPQFDDRSWRTLDLPHDWSIEGPFSQDA